MNLIESENLSRTCDAILLTVDKFQFHWNLVPHTNIDLIIRIKSSLCGKLIFIVNFYVVKTSKNLHIKIQ